MSVENETVELVVGEKYFVQSCTKDWVGELVRVVGPYTVVLREASWVANSGRLSEFMRSGNGGTHMEIEPVGVVCVQFVNWMPWPHKLFRTAI